MVHSMKYWPTSARRVGAAAAFVLVLAACGDDGATTKSATSGAGASSNYAAPAVTAAPTTVAAAVTTTAAPAVTTTAASAAGPLNLRVGTTSLGAVLVDGAGRTLYVFTKDEKNKSNCTGGCLSTWPPLLGTPTAGAGVTAAKLGSFTTVDGKTQATLDGMPLYYYAADTAPGDAKGQNVGTVWFVVDGAGVVKK